MNLAQQMKEFFDQYHVAPLEEWSAFARLLQPATFTKNQIIKEEFGVENSLHFIIKGSAGCFVWKDNNAVCLDLLYENDFLSDYMSLLTQKPSPIYIQAIEPLHVVSITGENLQRVYHHVPMAERVGRIAAESLFIHKQVQQIDLLTLTAEQRYQKLLDRQPQIILRTPQKHIASYLGVTPESFSRIRRNI
ncbi:MAG: Crp/Fnr family transcriptional regulator [Candidatus Kapabacteria bacterium]|nr:Crp/Fnr family transcriptional regulator [Candidatus Kapabacteria bacterium]MBX7153565.1 Crp/Fnr family transcriptional regulator [Bacteroidota bacterium]